jgi:hypothetical protein
MTGSPWQQCWRLCQRVAWPAGHRAGRHLSPLPGTLTLRREGWWLPARCRIVDSSPGSMRGQTGHAVEIEHVGRWDQKPGGNAGEHTDLGAAPPGPYPRGLSSNGAESSTKLSSW